MKGQMQKKLIIGLATVGIVGGLGLSYYTTQHMNEEPVDKKEQVESPKKNGEKTDKKPEEVIILNPLDGKAGSPLDKDKEEIKTYEASTAERDVREKFRQFQFEEGVTLLNDLDSKYRLTGDAEGLKDLQYDGALFSNILPDSHDHQGVYEHSSEGVLNIMKSFRDPENVLLGALSLDQKMREHVIVYDGSLNPVYEELEQISVLKKESMEIPHEVKVMYPDTADFHEIIFTLNGHTLYAYVKENEEGTVELYTIQDPSNTANYYTIAQWKKIHSNMEKGIPAFEGVLEMKSEPAVDMDVSETDTEENTDASEEEVVE